MNRSFGEHSGCSAEMRPVLVLESAGSYFLRVNASHRTEQPHGKLVLRHLKTENSYTGFINQSGMLGDIECQSRLTHRRPAGEDDQIGRLEPGSHLVQFLIAGGYPSDQF